MLEISGLTDRSSPPSLPISSFRFLNTLVGIEVEVERALDDFPKFVGWVPKEDPSLRNGGVEFVTMPGLRLYGVNEKLEGLFSYINNAKKSNPELYDFNERTSIHVHIDATTLSLEEIKNVLVTYILFEDSFFGIAGEARKHNVFCVPVRYIAMSELVGMSFARMLMTWKKYCAINFTRIGDIGTIEFRHMEGNSDPKRILLWVCLLAKLVDFGRTLSNKSLEKEIVKLKYASHYYEFAERVFGPFARFLNIVPHEFDQAVSDSKFFLTAKV